MCSFSVFLSLSHCPVYHSDVNDNVPFFMSSTYEATVPEGAEIGTSVAQVSASDLDSGLHGMVSGHWANSAALHASLLLRHLWGHYFHLLNYDRWICSLIQSRGLSLMVSVLANSFEKEQRLFPACCRHNDLIPPRVYALTSCQGFLGKDWIEHTQDSYVFRICMHLMFRTNYTCFILCL